MHLGGKLRIFFCYRVMHQQLGRVSGCGEGVGVTVRVMASLTTFIKVLIKGSNSLVNPTLSKPKSKIQMNLYQILEANQETH
jgi:Mg2+ and Co2+ transporter CorA